MPKKLGVLTVHGMGEQKKDYANSMIEELRRRIRDSSVAIDENDIAWEAGYWADDIQGDQDQLWKTLSKNPNMSYTKLRRFVVSALGDAVGYQRVSSPDGGRRDYYEEFHQSINESLKNLREKLGDDDKPLIVIAHSLGSVIMSNYIWDAQKAAQQATQREKMSGTAFDRMETLAGFITFGSTIPLFALAYNQRQNFQFPPDKIEDYFPDASPNRVRRAVKWINFFDADDVLGYPIRHLGPSYRMVQDKEINVGGLLTFWNPFSHTDYWTDNDFTVPVAKAIGGVLKLLRNTRSKPPPLTIGA